jgi:hypothetical protein
MFLFFLVAVDIFIFWWEMADQIKMVVTFFYTKMNAGIKEYVRKEKTRLILNNEKPSVETFCKRGWEIIAVSTSYFQSFTFIL